MLVGIRYSTFSLIYFALGIQSTAVISVDLISLQMLEMRSLYVVLDHAYHQKRAVNDTSTVYCDVGVVLDIVYCCIGVSFYSLFLIIDTKMICDSNKSMGGFDIDYDDHILCALQLYLDIVMIFVYLLRLLGECNN
jgi:hypothetical protein